MDVAQACNAAKALGHSWPSPHWWLSLTAADQGAWAAGFGAFAAALAALRISRRDRLIREREAHGLGLLTAAYLYVPVKRILHFTLAMQTHANQAAAVIAGAASINVAKDIDSLEIACNQIRPLRERIALTDLARLKWSAASPLAVVVSEIDQLVDAVEATVKAFRAAADGDDPDAIRVNAAKQLTIVDSRVRAINGRLEGFIAYCKDHRVPVVS